MAKNSVKPHPKVGLVKNTPPSNEVKQNYEDLTSEQREEIFNAMIQKLTDNFSIYIKRIRSYRFNYKGVSFGFTDRLYLLDDIYVIVSLLPEEKKIKIMTEKEFFDCYDIIDMVQIKGTWISLIKYSFYDDVRNLKKPFGKK